jgi:hypothetical protein
MFQQRYIRFLLQEAYPKAKATSLFGLGRGPGLKAWVIQKRFALSREGPLMR